MHVYECGPDRFIAASLEDARLAVTEYLHDVLGYPEADVLKYGNMDDLEQEDEGKVIGIYCDPKGEPCDPSDEGAKVIRKTAAEWATSRHRGFLCSSEY